MTPGLPPRSASDLVALAAPHTGSGAQVQALRLAGARPALDPGVYVAAQLDA